MSTFHAVVWMDHSEAHVVMFDREHTEAQRIKSRSHHKHQGKTEDLSQFFAAIAQALSGTREVLLAGPGLARNQFRDWCAKHNAAVAGAVVDLENTSFDSSLLDFDFDIDMPMESSPAGAAGLDLTSIDLDLDGFGESAEEVGEAEPETLKMTQDEQSGIGLESAEPAFEASSDEVDTKLELACAYDDMGDKEGALELLEEALREGSEAQQARAREMIARLS